MPTPSVATKAAPQAVARKVDGPESKSGFSTSGSRPGTSQNQQPAQNRPQPASGQKVVNGLAQQLGNVQIRSESNSKPVPAASRPTQGQSGTPNSGVAARQNQIGSSQSRPAQPTNLAGQSGQQAAAPSSQIVYGPRSVSGPFGQYNSMQYTIIGGSLAGSVVGGSHAGSVVGDSLTPSLVIGDWFGGDYV